MSTLELLFLVRSVTEAVNVRVKVAGMRRSEGAAEGMVMKMRSEKTIMRDYTLVGRYLP